MDRLGHSVIDRVLFSYLVVTKHRRPVSFVFRSDKSVQPGPHDPADQAGAIMFHLRMLSPPLRLPAFLSCLSTTQHVNSLSTSPFKKFSLNNPY